MKPSRSPYMVTRTFEFRRERLRRYLRTRPRATKDEIGKLLGCGSKAVERLIAAVGYEAPKLRPRKT